MLCVNPQAGESGTRISLFLLAREVAYRRGIEGRCYYDEPQIGRGQKAGLRSSRVALANRIINERDERENGISWL